MKERGWRDEAIWLLSDTELLEAADTEAAYEEEVADYDEDYEIEAR